MRALLAAFVTIPAIAGLVAMLVLVPVIWLFSPLLGTGSFYPFDDVLPRALLCTVPVLAYIAIIIVMARRRSRQDAALVEAVTVDPTAERVAAEEAQLREKLTQALVQLRTATGGKGTYLYELPWYIIIGPPGSGKTTALMNAGLEFPLAEGGKVSGVGGTRNCDWWITERALLIDTAGRYTTQDSDAAADKAGWERFLQLLRRNRPKQPLNGVVVCFGVDMISRLDATEREAHARTVRRRIKELETQLGQRLPVYLLVSKADQLAGFVEFFDDLDRETRAQVWGMTFPVDRAPEGVAAKFGAEFQALLKRLQDRLLERLQQERGPSQRAAIAGFPAQFASLEQPLAGFVTAAFGGSRIDPAPFLRGVYLSSGTQDGTVLDRLTGALARSFGLDARRPAGVMGQKGRSYFLGRLLRDVVFNEARLAARDRGIEQRRRLVAAAVWCLCLLLSAGGAFWGWSIYNAEQRRAEALAQALQQAEGIGGRTTFSPVSDGELRAVLPYLDSVRPLPAAAHSDSGGGLGLSQQDRLVAGGEAAYRRALDRAFLPRLLARLEGQLRANTQRADFLYEATRVYLMLGKVGPLDAALVREWMLLDWQRSYPGAVGQPLRDQLMAHLDAMLAQDFATYPLDGALVDAARRIFSRLPMSERVYSRLKPLAQDIAPWRPADALGPAGQRLFQRASGRPLTEGVAGIYTIDGLYRGLLPRIGQAVRDAASESWVLGPQAAASGAEDPARLEQAVLQLYAQDYVRAWQAMLDDLVLPRFTNLNDAANGLNILGAPNSPMRDLLRSAARQLSPGTPPEGFAPRPADPSAQRAAAAQGQQQQPTGAEPVAAVVEQQFRALREASGQPIDAVLQIVSELYVQVARLANSPPGTVMPVPGAGLAPGPRLEAEAVRQPDPLAKWLRSLAQNSGAIIGGGARAAIAAAGAQQLAPLCRGIETRFPFRRDAAQDMPQGDFARLFAPGQMLDQFFNTNIRPYVDTTQNPWRPMATQGQAAVVSPADAVAFQRAALIRDAFFPAGMPLRFELIPQGFDPGANGAVLEAEGIRTEIGRTGPFRPLSLGWPARGNVTLTFDPAASTGPLAFDGDWAALKLVMGRQAALVAVPNAPDRMRVTITQGDRRAAFELRTASSVHPFSLQRELAEFRCPALPAQ